MTVTVAEENGVHRALVPGADTVLRCCREGHESAEEAARHARAIARTMARRGQAAGNAGRNLSPDPGEHAGQGKHS